MSQRKRVPCFLPVRQSKRNKATKGKGKGTGGQEPDAMDVDDGFDPAQLEEARIQSLVQSHTGMPSNSAGKPF